MASPPVGQGRPLTFAILTMKSIKVVTPVLIGLGCIAFGLWEIHAGSADRFFGKGLLHRHVTAQEHPNLFSAYVTSKISAGCAIILLTLFSSRYRDGHD